MIQVKAIHLHRYEDPEIYVHLVMVGEEGTISISMNPRFEVDL